MMTLLLVVFSVISGMIAIKISNSTKIPLLLVLILMGIILQITGITNQEQIVSAMNRYTQMVSITMIYVMAGYAMEAKKPEKIIMQVGTLPSVILITVFSPIISLLIYMITGSISLITILIVINVVAIAVNSTPVLFLQTYTKLSPDEQKNPHNMKILSAAVFDQMPVFAFIIIPMIISLGVVSATGSIQSILIQIVLQIAILLLTITLFYQVSKFTVNLLVGKINDHILLLLMIVIANVIIMLIPILRGQYLTAGLGIGLGMNSIKKYDVGILKTKFQTLVALFAFPIMFIALGMGIKLTQLFNLKMFIIAFIIYLVFVIGKALLVKMYLKRYNYSANEIRIGILFTLLTGATYINMAITFQPIYQLAGYNNLVTNLSIIGIILYIYSILISPILINKKDIIIKMFRLE